VLKVTSLVFVGAALSVVAAGAVNKFCWECWWDYDECLDAAIDHWETCVAGCGQNQSCIDQCDIDFDLETAECDYVLDMCLIDCVDKRAVAAVRAQQPSTCAVVR
jgi:hypothetical protein